MLVAQSLHEVAALDYDQCTWGKVTVPESAWRQVAFMRVWCLVELQAARDNGKPVVMCCGSAVGDAATGGHKFVNDGLALNNLEWLVDVTAAEASDPADKQRILAEIAASEGGAAALSAWVSAAISGAYAACV